MTFNQVIWDALCLLRRMGREREADEALAAYAASCDGTMQWKMADGRYGFKFAPNPIPRY
jgi:hypothetical protein